MLHGEKNKNVQQKCGCDIWCVSQYRESVQRVLPPPGLVLWQFVLDLERVSDCWVLSGRELVVKRHLLQLLKPLQGIEFVSLCK